MTIADLYKYIQEACWDSDVLSDTSEIIANKVVERVKNEENNSYSESRCTPGDDCLICTD